LAVLTTSNAAFTGKVAGDQLAVGQASGQFANSQPGLNKSVAITGITLTGTDAGNYTLADSTATSTANIFARPPVLPTVLAPEAAPTPSSTDAKLDTSNPVLVAGAPSLVAAAAAAAEANTVQVKVLREPSALRGGEFQASVPRLLAASQGFSFTLPYSLRSAIKASGGKATVTQADGRPLPAWLRFDAEGLQMVASKVPAGGLPIRLAVNFGNQTAEFLIDLI
jgi:hypothetical protein